VNPYSSLSSPPPFVPDSDIVHNANIMK
jgi:hypothetical protein